MYMHYVEHCHLCLCTWMMLSCAIVSLWNEVDCKTLVVIFHYHWGIR